jgi:hypothetical protein
LLSVFSPTLAHDATRNALNVRIVFTAIDKTAESHATSTEAKVEKEKGRLQQPASLGRKYDERV